MRLVTSMRPALVLPKSISTACTAFATAVCNPACPKAYLRGHGQSQAGIIVRGVDELGLGWPPKAKLLDRLHTPYASHFCWTSWLN